MKKLLVVLLLTLALTLVSISIVGANGDATGGCPNSFERHMVPMAGNHDHGQSGEHHHVGNDQDFNRDGYICAKHVGPNGSIHVHIDNNVPLP